jgi:hypothetical protein
MAVTTETKDKIDMLTWDDCHITTSKLCATTGSGKPTVMAIIRKLGYRKCSPSNTKTAPKHISEELHQYSEKDGDAFLSNIITGDEIWFHHYDP